MYCMCYSLGCHVKTTIIMQKKHLVWILFDVVWYSLTVTFYDAMCVYAFCPEGWDFPVSD